MVIGGVATIPSRKKAFRRMLESVLPHVDEIHVYLSGYVGYLRNLPDKVIQHKPKNGIDLCDSGKFVGLKRAYEMDANFVSFDDDLLYPFDYVFGLNSSIDQDSKCVYSFHGRSFAGFPISSYYKSATIRFYCLHRELMDIRVHVGGTGCMGFKPSEVGVKVSDFPTPYMADIHMGVYCKNKGISIVCLAHKGEWIKHLPIDHSQTIYRQQVNHDEEQTRRINEAFG